MANDGGSPWRYCLGEISTHRGCGGWRRKRRMVRRLGGFWRLLRSTTARRGQAWHPSQRARDQRTASTYIFGAVCPQQGKGAALILPACNTEAMNLHLAEIAKTVAPGAHAVLLVDQAGWHMSTRLAVPPNITIIALV